MEEINVSAAIVTYNSNETALNALKSLKNNTKRYPLSVFIFDNGSTDNTVSLLEDTNLAKVVKTGKNLGFGKAHNLSLNEKLGKYHFVVNPDIVLNSDALSDTVDYMEKNPDVVMCMPKILSENGKEQFVPKEVPTFKRLFLGRIFKSIRDEYCWRTKEIKEPCEIDFCSGCFFCIRTDIWQKLNGFDERFFMYLEDGDLTLRAKKLGKVVVNPHITVIHKWDRASAKSIKYLFIHTCSCFKFLLGRRRYK